MGRKKGEKTYIKTIRVSKDIKEFLESLDNANLFVLQLIIDTEQFENFLKKRDHGKQGLLF